MRALWTGTLRFGLLVTPVKLYPAAQERGGIAFTYLHKRDLAPVQYVRICKADGREVPFDQVVRGYRYEKGDYIVVSDADLRRAGANRVRVIDIIDFTEEGEVDPKLYERPFFLAPEEGAEKPYILVREALRRSGRAGVARFVFRGREHLALVRPEDRTLVLNQLRFPSDLRPSEELTFPERPVEEQELAVALDLIRTLTGSFRPEEYRDTYTEELQRVIEAKARGKIVAAHKKTEQPTDMKDVLHVLRQSLERAAKRPSPKSARTPLRRRDGTPVRQKMRDE